MADSKLKVEEEEPRQSADLAEELEQAAQVDEFLKKWCARQEQPIKMGDAVAVPISLAYQLPQTSGAESQGPSSASHESNKKDEQQKQQEQQEQQEKQGKQEQREEEQKPEPDELEQEEQPKVVDQHFASLCTVHQQMMYMEKILFPVHLFSQASILLNPEAGSGPSSAPDGSSVDKKPKKSTKILKPKTKIQEENLSPTDRYLYKLCTIQQEIAQVKKVIADVTEKPPTFEPENPEPVPGPSNASDDPNKKDDTNTEGKGDDANPIPAKELKRRRNFLRRLKKIKQVEIGMQEVSDAIDVVYEMIDRDKQLKKLRQFQKDLDEDRHLN